MALPTITKKEFDDYQQLCKDRNNGRILTPNGLRFICESYKNDPKAIGKHMLEMMARFQATTRWGYTDECLQTYEITEG
ncbi:hypothetical protein DW802_01950 [Ruminococcus bromii]|nr:hypothetical protein DW802_01950 [Ruminococcus bromii]